MPGRDRSVSIYYNAPHYNTRQYFPQVALHRGFLHTTLSSDDLAQEMSCPAYTRS